MAKWQCPQDCPYQRDDTITERLAQLLFNGRMFFLVSSLTGFYWFNAIYMEGRSLKEMEFLVGAGAVAVTAAEPLFLPELLKRYARKRLGVDQDSDKGE